MTEKEKCQLGLLYDANYDEELLRERAECKDLCYEYNQLRPSQTGCCAVCSERPETTSSSNSLSTATTAITSKSVKIFI